MPSLWLRFWIIFLQDIPDLLALLFFVAASYGAYVVIYARYFVGICPIYLSLLTAIIILRTLSLLCRIFVEPGQKRLSFIQLDIGTARRIYYGIMVSSGVVVFGIMCINW